jgi:hypothetical protein
MDLVKAEVCMNYSTSWNEFEQNVINNRESLKAAKSDKKYLFEN